MLCGVEGPVLFNRQFCNRKWSNRNGSIFESICISFRKIKENKSEGHDLVNIS